MCDDKITETPPNYSVVPASSKALFVLSMVLQLHPRNIYLYISDIPDTCARALARWRWHRRHTPATSDLPFPNNRAKPYLGANAKCQAKET